MQGYIHPGNRYYACQYDRIFHCPGLRGHRRKVLVINWTTFSSDVPFRRMCTCCIPWTPLSRSTHSMQASMRPYCSDNCRRTPRFLEVGQYWTAGGIPLIPQISNIKCINDDPAGRYQYHREVDTALARFRKRNGGYGHSHVSEGVSYYTDNSDVFASHSTSYDIDPIYFFSV
jgi:hypothetical protein